MSQPNLESMSDEEFEEAWTQAAVDLDAARELCRAFSAEQKRRDAVKQLEEMDPETVAMLAEYAANMPPAQGVQPEGVESEEDVTNG